MWPCGRCSGSVWCWSAAAPGELPGRADLARTPFLAFRSGCGYRTTIEVLLADLKVAAPRIHEFGSLDAIVGCVGAGMGLALLPASTVDQYRRRHTLHTLDLPGDRGRVTTMIATLKQASWSRALEVFMEGCRARPVMWRRRAFGPLKRNWTGRRARKASRAGRAGRAGRAARVSARGLPGRARDRVLSLRRWLRELR
ncbi:hypothetical protein HML84_15605 [Alcanivorax sp. IO_7]|nr:hypothetical protein HML84_15605 [Alcanivorax sp. IO_7]